MQAYFKIAHIHCSLKKKKPFSFSCVLGSANVVDLLAPWLTSVCLLSNALVQKDVSNFFTPALS